MYRKPRILITPLNWGLGHATRCIPVIRELIRHGAEVVIGADGHPLALLKEEFPRCEFAVVPPWQVSYPAGGNMAGAMISQLPLFLASIRKEHRWLDNFASSGKIDAVISDNRYGMWNKKIYSVFMTHQLMVKCPLNLKFLEPVLHIINKMFIRQFNECWIPDMKDENNLSGDLSHRYPLPSNGKFIGWLSRFYGSQRQPNQTQYDLVILLSGPEPQRTVLEQIVTEKLSTTGKKIILVRGLPSHKCERKLPGVFFKEYSHLPAAELEVVLEQSEAVLARPGYSTVMDMAAMNKKVILVPTPGQTEQEYLAAYLNSKWGISIINQHSIDAALFNSRITKAIEPEKDHFQKINDTVRTLLEKLSGYQ